MEEEKKLETTIKKNQTAEIPTKAGSKYSYQYVDIAQIHEYLELNNMRYYQFIKRIENDDYIFTQKLKLETNKWVNDGEALQGCKVVDATLMGVSNPAQQQGSALTYARRYSLLMAYGLATEDDDAQSLTKPKGDLKVEIKTKEQAENYILTFGKFKGKTLKEIIKTQPNYADWLYDNGTDDIKNYMNLMLDQEPIPPKDAHIYDGAP